MLDEGAVTSRVNVDRPGQISIVDCRTYNVGGHHLRVGSPGGSGGYGAYRIHVANFENSGYETGTSHAALLDEPANSVLYGERSEERRVGKGCVSKCKSRWSRDR